MVVPRNLSKIAPALQSLAQSLQVRDNVQGIALLVGRRLEKTLTIKCEVWDLIDTQDKNKMPEDDRFMLSVLVYLSFQFKRSCFLISCEL